MVLNAATVGLLVGFGLGNMKIVGAAGIVVMGAVASHRHGRLAVRAAKPD